VAPTMINASAHTAAKCSTWSAANRPWS
jgi:hypothetical protein